MSRYLKKESLVNVKQILAVTDPQVSFEVVVANTGLTADSNGKKILRAGTPITGSLEARNTAFVKAASSGTPLASNATAILLHDVDVTDGNNNGSALVFGFVNTDRVDTTTKALITAEVKAALKGLVTFVK